ncbi:carbon-nitrogen hydrolase family protein [Pseudomonas sp. GX19020]|uniref:carbon-nitrogen hydrolase family protein n=1 Tax=Pseudomonas sp. GX19020 TaxID=2942277 RepID=UPI00201A189E|nr:carbon-nitrogen hydrolase family protein [Pseudomonas sp. GX19020]MCL4069198.1 carbon-nitrogen hydrolase family protein [Pseudomonas sp. GX19020]
MKVALWQAKPTNGNIEAAFSAICTQLQAAATAGAKLLLAPELLLPGYNRPDLHESLSQPLDGAWITRLREMAARAGCGICLGWAERDGDTVYNAATTISPDGAVLAHYRKVQLFGPMERRSFRPGDQLCPVFELEGRKLAMLVCYDIEFPAHAAALARNGAGLILVPTANPAGFEHVQRILVPARAHEGNCTVAYANLTGPEGDLTFGGLSVIAGPDGQPLATAGARGEALLIVDLAASDAVPEDLRSAQTADFRPV